MSDTTPCMAGYNNNNKPIPQTLFLGASIADFSTNLGWGSQSSSVSVSLVRDVNYFNNSVFRGTGTTDCRFRNQFPASPGPGGTPHNYHESFGDDIYARDGEGKIIKSKMTGQKMLRGKIEYGWNSARNQFCSLWWTAPDPGFIGAANNWAIGGSFPGSNRGEAKNYTDNDGYDIIGVPVYFRMLDFEFIGLVKNWNYTDGSGGQNISLQLESPTSILANSYVVASGYKGSVGLYNAASQMIMPQNFSTDNNKITTINQFDWRGNVSDGAVHNFFNAFGLLETYGKFGYSGHNEQGTPSHLIKQALTALTSSDTPLAKSVQQFSTFGRIVSKSIHKLENYTYPGATSGFYRFGLIPPADNMQPNGHPLYRYKLDMSELPDLPNLRINTPVLTVLDFITQLAEASGKDFFIDCIPDFYNGAIDMVLKVRTVERLMQPQMNQVKDNIESLITSGAFTDIDGVPAVSDISYGHESNESVERKVIIGGQQQRLFQAKNYRLAYTQNTFRLRFVGGTPVIVDYTKYNKSTFKTPTGYSTRNTTMTYAFEGGDVPYGSVVSLSEYNTILANIRSYENGIKTEIDGTTFSTTETVFADEPLLWSVNAGGTTQGNYFDTTDSWYTVGSRNAYQTVGYIPPIIERFTPLYLDIISPFFGYRFEDPGGGNDDGLSDEARKKPRTVFMDNFTGQICVVCDIKDLKGLRFNLSSLYGNGQFVVTETEMRAAMAGFDNLVLYYTYKLFKADLFLMLRKAFLSGGVSAFKENGPAVGIMPFGMLDDEDASGPEGQSAEPTPSGDESTDQGANSIIYSKAFVTDLQILHNFLSQLAGKYYGKSYMVRMPGLSGYRDWDANQTVTLGNDRFGKPIKMWKGPPKSHLSYEISTDGAWEEFGNVIDEDITIGTPNSYRLMDETGKIQPVLGYNAQSNFDTVAKYMCSNRATLFNSNVGNTLRNNKGLNVFGLSTYSFVADNIDFDCTNSKFEYPALDYSSITSTSYVFTEENRRRGVSLFPSDPTQLSPKLYITASVRPKIVFEQPVGFNNPRAIIESPGLFMNSSSLSHTQDMNRALNANIALEDLTQILFSVNGLALTADPYPTIIKALYSRVCSIWNNTYIRRKSTQTQNNQMIDIAPKAAHPFFAAIPVKSNEYVYGPWANFPYESRDKIVMDSNYNKVNYVDNMVNGLVVEKDDELVPWNYGGMTVLDKAALLKVSDGLKYQSVAENATFTVVGAPKFGLGAKLVGTYDTGGTVNFGKQPFNRATDSYNFNGYTFAVNYLKYAYADNILPTISNMQLKIGSSGISTTYNLKIYSKPLSRFNKDAADRLKRNATDAFRNNKKLSQISNEAQSKLLTLNQESVTRTAGGGPEPYTASSQKLLGWSPSTVLMAQGTYYLAGPNVRRLKTVQNSTDSTNNTGPSDPDDDTGEETDSSGAGAQSTSMVKALNASRPSYPISGSSGYANNRKGYPGDINSYRSGSSYGGSMLENQGQVAFTMREVRHGAYVGLYPDKEVGIDINNNYAMKGVMSLDGLFSPVSFYPTLHNSCYNLAKWKRNKCPVCKGNKIYQDSIYVGTQEQTIYQYCKYCTDEVDEDNNANKDIPLIKVMEYKARASLVDIKTGTFKPPFITVKNEDDQEVISDNYYFKDNDANKATINTHSLQPILQESGDFLNPNSQPEDKGRHSINVVGRGTRQPDNKYELIINKNLEKTYFGKNPDFHGESDVRLADYLTKIKQSTGKDVAGFDNGVTDYPLNNRYLGLRGPLVLHSWGYDLEGYPFPNMADDPKHINAQGIAKRHIRKQKDGKYINEDDYEQQGGYPSSGADMNQYGSVIGVNQEWITYPDGVQRWTPKKKSHKFSLNWGERPDKWATGPIDLRWDEARGVWTAPLPKIYKNVYVTLEEDLDFYGMSNPSRGFLVDYEGEVDDDDERKVVFVVDKTGYTAPRGTSLLCSFNIDSGFYEPISKPVISALGTIGTGNNASITLSYIITRDRSRSGDTKSFNFSNPLGLYFESGDRGMFNFIEGKWTLISVKG